VAWVGDGSMLKGEQVVGWKEEVFNRGSEGRRGGRKQHRTEGRLKSYCGGKKKTKATNMRLYS